MPQETNTFTVSGNPFVGMAVIQSSDPTKFTNITDIQGQLLNPIGTTNTSFPINLAENQGVSMTWSTEKFGFDTLRLDPDKRSNIWDEWQTGISQTWTAVPETTTPAGLVVTATTVTLDWDDVTGATSYAVFRDGIELGAGPNSDWLDTGLTPQTSHNYTVAARNSGGTSASTTAMPATTTADDSWTDIPGSEVTADSSALSSTTPVPAAGPATFYRVVLLP